VRKITMDEWNHEDIRRLRDLVRRLNEIAGQQEGTPPCGFKIVVRNSGIAVLPIGRKVEEAPVIRPHTEVAPVGDMVYMNAELPGIDVEDIALSLAGSVLVIETHGEPHMQARVHLPPVEQGSMHMASRNGVLEISFRRRKNAAKAPAEE
jgi:HSP20 family molecular chaperone IbpA